MGLFDILTGNKTTKNGLNLIYDGKTKNLLYAFNKKNGKIEGLFQVFYSVEDSGLNPNYKRNDVGFVNKEFVFINGLINGNFKEYDSKGNLLYYIENIKSNSFSFILKFSCRNFYTNKELPVNREYQINGLLFRYNPDGTFSKAKIIESNKLLWENYYQNGQIMYDSVERKYFYANGQLKEDLKNGVVYYEDGAIKIKNGEEFYNNGQLKFDLINGKEYCENGQLKFDLINGREYYDNGAIKIKNDNGARYFLAEKLNEENFKDSFSFDSFIKSDSIVSNYMMYNYYKNLSIYNEKGEFYNIGQIMEIYSQENYFNRINRIRNEFRARGGHISITPKNHSGTKYSEPLLINNFCFIANVEYYRNDYPYNNDYQTTTHLNPYTGLFNNIHYENGINSSSDNFYPLENESKLENNVISIAIEYYERAKNKFHELKDYSGAMDDFNKSIQKNPSFSKAFLNRGILKKVMEDYLGALEDYNKAIELDEDSDAYRFRAGVKSTLKDFSGAMNDYNFAIEKHPNQQWMTYYKRGCLKIELEDYKGAIHDFDLSIDANINSNKRWPRSDFFKKRGDCKFKIEDYKGAIEDFNKAIELNPNCIDEVKMNLELAIKQLG